MNESESEEQLGKVSPTLLTNIENFLASFEDRFEDINTDTLEKFIQIKDLIDSKTLDMQQLHDKIQELLSISEMYDLLRVERWPDGVICLYCGHEKVIKLGKFLNKNKYMCEKCHREFFDDSDTPLEPDRVMIAIMLHLLLSAQGKTEVINFLKNTYGFKKEYLEKLIPELQQDNLLGDQPFLKFISFSGIEHLTITDFRENLTSGILHDAIVGHTRRKRPSSKK